jgi:hypothetical protein|tara:strand:- start:698 stop:877 length:180 start_codon:yes stop_codon:yes gene_type:complete
MESENVRYNSARFERPSTGSWLTVSFPDIILGFSLKEWEVFGDIFYEGWELVCCGDNIE